MPEPSRTLETALLLCRGLEEVCACGAEKGVKVNLEIHGDFNAIESITPVVERMGGVPAFGILWDVMHSDRAYGDDYLPFYELIPPVHPPCPHQGLPPESRAGAEPSLPDGAGGRSRAGNRGTAARGTDTTAIIPLNGKRSGSPEIEEPEVAFLDYMHYMKELLK